MPDFMMIMKHTSKTVEAFSPDNVPNDVSNNVIDNVIDNDPWGNYLEKLQNSGLFRGGSVLDNGQCINRSGAITACSVSGFMRFEADNLDQIKALLAGNPAFEAGCDIEVLELVLS